ncbi:MAG: AAA family ATPase [Holophagales bacterium]|nr:AAA family ATPase [Holophagales bacterium]
MAEGLITEVPSIRSEADADTFMAAFEESHQALLELQEDTYQFFGERNVGGGKLDTFTQFVYVPAVRDAQQETGSKGTSFSQLLDLAVLRRVNALPQVAGLLQQLRKIVTETFEPEEVRGSLTTLEKDINAVLQPFVPTESLSLRWSGEPSVTYEAPKILPSLTEDAFSGEISRKGHGLQRALILALLSHLARVRTARTEPGEMAPQSDVLGGPARDLPPAVRRGPDYIIGIEEPELYQHPNRCRHFASVLRHLAAEQGEDGSNTQILFTTHSPYFVSLEHFENVRLVRKDARDAFGLTCTSLSSHTVEEFRVAWADICGRDPQDVTVGSLLARLLRTMTDSVSEGFFADVVVLVEGIGDVGVLTAVAEEKKAEWVAQGVTVLAVDGKENLAAPILIFRALGIPTYFIFDGDQHLKGKGKSCNEHQAKATQKGFSDSVAFR